MGGEERERSANLDVLIGEGVCQCAFEAAEVVREVGEQSLPVVERQHPLRDSAMLYAGPENRAPEDDATVLEKRFQITGRRTPLPPVWSGGKWRPRSARPRRTGRLRARTGRVRWP